MNFRTLAARRKAAGLLGTTILLIVLALLAEGMIAGGRKDPNAYELLPGQSLKLTDPMPRGAENLQDLNLRASDPGIAVQLEETFSGFWLGGTLWRAEATLAANLSPGAYTLAMHYQNGTESTPSQVYRLSVREDAAAIRAASLSVTTRLTGFSPYFLAVCLLPLALLPMLASFLLSRTIAQVLRAEGITEVYRAMASPEGQRIFFGLGSQSGLALDALVEVLDEQADKVLGTALVVEIKPEDAVAVMQDNAQVRPGVLARSIRS